MDNNYVLYELLMAMRSANMLVSDEKVLPEQINHNLWNVIKHVCELDIYDFFDIKLQEYTIEKLLKVDIEEPAPFTEIINFLTKSKFNVGDFS